MPKQDLRILKTLKEIDRALLECLCEAPIEKITVDQICQRAVINRSTFYTYYCDKFDLLHRYLDRILFDFRKQVDVTFINATPQNVDDLVYQKNFEQILLFMKSNQQVYQLLWDLPLERSIFQEMIQTIHDRIMEQLPSALNESSIHYADLYARLFASDMMTLVRWWFTYSNCISSEELQEIMSSNIKKGMFKTFFDHMK